METIERSANLVLGQIGSFLVLLAFSAAMIGLIAYFFATKNEKNPWLGLLGPADIHGLGKRHGKNHRYARQ